MRREWAADVSRNVVFQDLTPNFGVVLAEVGGRAADGRALAVEGQRQ
jgi:hypothetical protein